MGKCSDINSQQGMLRQIKPAAPSDLPWVKLYLDDIRQIIQILKDAEAGRDEDRRQGDRDKPIQLSFRVGNQVGFDLGDLSDAHPNSTHDYEMHLDRGNFRAAVYVNRRRSYWYAWGLTDQEAWVLFHQLDTLFNSRRRRWINFWRKHDTIAFFTFTGLLLIVLISLNGIIAGGPTYRSGWTGFCVLAVLILSIAFLGALLTVLRGSLVIFREHYKHAEQFSEKLWKILPSVVSGTIGLAAGIFLSYLKHRFWP
jgi:hypothetical protein